jgi:[methyl-Co(III) methanol-specific corrinoid protein]:coenzyme M methyltransferase
MMSACVTEISALVGRGRHSDPETMAVAARKIHELTGFENFGVPYCLTAEAEPLGAGVELGDIQIEPRITTYNDRPLEKIMASHAVDVAAGRMGAVLKAVEMLKNSEIPVIGNVSGHISTATSIVDPLVVFRMLRREPERVSVFFAFINEYLIRYGKAMARAGADVITISDPTATGEILGRRSFEQFAVPFYRDTINALHKEGVPVIIHICGNTRNVIESLNNLPVDAVSFDAIVSMKLAREGLKTRLMGNVSTELLHRGEQEKIRSAARRAIQSGVDIVAPACGLSMATPVANLRAMTDFVKEGLYRFENDIPQFHDKGTFDAALRY